MILLNKTICDELFLNIPYQPNIDLKIHEYISHYNGGIISVYKNRNS